MMRDANSHIDLAMADEAARQCEFALKVLIRDDLAQDLRMFKNMDRPLQPGEPRAYSAATVSFFNSSKLIVEAAMARYRLRGDLQEARSILREIELRRPLVDEAIRCIEAGIRGEITWDGTKCEQRSLFFALCASALLGDRSGIEWLGERRNSPAFYSDAEADNEMDDFVRQLLHIYAGGSFDEVVFGFRRGARKGDWDFGGYRELPALIAKHDWEGFAAKRSALESRYPDRVRSRRDSGLNIYGYGKMGQLTSIDLLGTVICRFAHWSGYDAAVNSVFYPRAFYAE